MRTTLGRSEDQAEKNELWLLERFLPWCHKSGLTRLHEVESTHVEQFRSTWTVGPVTAQRATERISSFFLYCIRNKWLTTNPCSGLQPISVPPPKAEYFTEEECEQIMDSISCYGLELFREDQRKIARTRLSAMVELLRWTGLRISDAACLPRQDLIQEHGRWLIRTEITKKSGRIKRTVIVTIPITPDLAMKLQNVPQAQYTSPYYFFWSGQGKRETQGKDWWERLSKLFALAELKNVDGTPKRAHPHMFRDTFAIHYLSEGVSLEEVSHMLGHANTKITEKFYAHWCKSRHDRLYRSVSATWKPSGPQLLRTKKTG